MQVLDAYRKNYIIFKPYYFSDISQLINEVNRCETESDLLKLLYACYGELMKKRSIKLAEKLGIILAEALNVSNDEIKIFFNQMRYSHLLLMLNCSVQLHKAWMQQEEEDPIEVAYGKRQLCVRS